MKPRWSVTFLLDGEHWQVPFNQDHQADLYVQKIGIWWPEATNVLVNDLST